MTQDKTQSSQGTQEIDRLGSVEQEWLAGILGKVAQVPYFKRHLAYLQSTKVTMQVVPVPSKTYRNMLPDVDYGAGSGVLAVKYVDPAHKEYPQQVFNVAIAASLLHKGEGGKIQVGEPNGETGSLVAALVSLSEIVGKPLQKDDSVRVMETCVKTVMGARDQLHLLNHRTIPSNYVAVPAENKKVTGTFLPA